MLRVFAWGKKFDWLQTLRNNFDPNNTQQHATGCAKWNSIGSCWPTMLRLFATVFYKSKLLCEEKHKQICKNQFNKLKRAQKKRVTEMKR